tara:strand:- start:198 stop:509 length:312 start_codon:yes stop_codon:yes gene_type:complete
MKSYLQGMLTGGALVLSFMFLIGAQKYSQKQFSKTYRDKLVEIEDRVGMLEGVVKERFKLAGENFIFLRDKNSFSMNTEYNFNSMILVDETYPFLLITDRLID